MNEIDYYDLIFEEPDEKAFDGNGSGAGSAWRRQFIERIAAEAPGQWVRWPKSVTVKSAATLAAQIRKGSLRNGHKNHDVVFPAGTWECRWARHEGSARLWLRYTPTT